MRRQGAPMSLVYKSLVYMWVIIPFIVQVLQMYTEMHVSCSGLRLNYERDYITIVIISYIAVTKCVSSIIIFYMLYDIDSAINANVSVVISSSKKRIQRYLQLQKFLRSKVIFKISDLVLFIAMFISLLIIVSNDLHFFTLYAFILNYTSSEIVCVYYDLYKRSHMQ